MRIYEPHKSSIFDLDANLVAAFCYIAATVVGFVPLIGWAAWVVPILMYFMETKSELVRFHAAQAITLNLAVWIVEMVARAFMLIGGAAYSLTGLSALRHLPRGVGSVFLIICGIAQLTFSILALVRAYSYSEYDIPLIEIISRKFYRPRY